MHLNKRPKPNESEDEILAQEKAFLHNLKLGQGANLEPAAKVVRKSKEKEKELENLSSLKSKVDQKLGQQDYQSDDDEEMQCTPAEEHPSLLSSEVKERIFDPTKLQPFIGQKSLPNVKLLNKPVSAFSKNKSLEKKCGKSLFALSFDSTYGTSTTEQKNPMDISKSSPMGVGDQIHPYLCGMTEEEILAEQKILMEKLDPKLIDFIKSRKEKKSAQENISVPIKMEITEEPNEIEASQSHVMSNFDLPIDPKEVENIPGMNKLELDKLAWTGSINMERTSFNKPKEGANARFDFQGMLIRLHKSEDPNTYASGLHHHGQEMDRPGYTLEELLTLTRSTNSQQRTAALQTIGNIFENSHTGMYDHVFEKSLFQVLDYMDFICAIRKALDEKESTSINMAFECLAKIIYPWEEELCLDMVYLWDGSKPHPCLLTKEQNLADFMEPDSSEEEMKDFEVLKADLLEFLIHRSDLLDRIQYFLIQDLTSLNESGIEGILKLLIRITRHSPNSVIERKPLIKFLIDNYASAHWLVSGAVTPRLQGIPLPMALKIIRILIDSSVRNAGIIYSEFSIFSSVMAYLAYEDWKSQEHIRMVESLIMESFRIWIALISQGFALHEYSSFFPVIMKFLSFYRDTQTLNLFDLSHSGHLLSLLIAILRMDQDSKGINEKDKHSHWDLVKDTVSFIEFYTIRLFRVLTSPHLDGTYDQTGMLFALSKTLKFLLEVSKNQTYKISEDVLSAVLGFFSTGFYDKLTVNFLKQSVILMTPDANDRYPSNFASIKAIRFGGKWNPMVEYASYLPFLTSLLEFLNSYAKVPVKTLINSNISAYTTELLKSKTQSGKEADFFVRFELNFILQLAQIYPETSFERFSLAYKALSEVPKCCYKIFNQLFKLALISSCTGSEREDCLKIYSGYLIEDNRRFISDESKDDDTPSKKKVKFDSSVKSGNDQCDRRIEFQSWTEKSIESRHWILEPLQRMYTIVTSVPNYISKHMDEIENHCKICLQLIYKCLENYCDFIIQAPKDFVSVYCSICQVFILGDPGVYLGEEVTKLLTKILHILVRSQVVKNGMNKPLFSKRKWTLTNPIKFFDFYPDLIKEYAGNSYFNEIFAAYLMIPLRVSEDLQLKSNFWMMDCINSFKFNVEKSKIPLEFFTGEAEKDQKMLDIYMKLLLSGKLTKAKNEFLFEIARHHLQSSADMMDEKVGQLFSKLQKDIGLDESLFDIIPHQWMEENRKEYQNLIVTLM